MSDKKPVPPSLAQFALEQLAEAGEQTIRAGVTIDADAAARVLAEGLDYPWGFMPENGRQSMRELARRVVEAAQLNPCRAQSSGDGWRMVKVGSEGVQFGNAWFSHEGITGYTAEQLNSGNCRVTGRAYMDWLAAAPSAKKESE